MQLIFGANGPSGRAYIRTLTDSADVVAVLRKPSEDSFLSVESVKNTSAVLPHSKLSCAKLGNNKTFPPECHTANTAQANSAASSNHNAAVCTPACFRRPDRWKTARLKSARVQFGYVAIRSCWGRSGDRIWVRCMMVLRFYNFDVFALVSSLN